MLENPSSKETSTCGNSRDKKGKDCCLERIEIEFNFACLRPPAVMVGVMLQMELDRQSKSWEQC